MCANKHWLERTNAHMWVKIKEYFTLPRSKLQLYVLINSLQFHELINILFSFFKTLFDGVFHKPLTYKITLLAAVKLHKVIHRRPPLTHIYMQQIPPSATCRCTIIPAKRQQWTPSSPSLCLSVCQKPSHLAKELSGTHHQGYICCPKADTHNMPDTHTHAAAKEWKLKAHISPSEKCWL